MPPPPRWLTPEDTPDGTRCIQLIVPNGDEWEAIVRGALIPLIYAYNFEQSGSYTPDETAAVFREAIETTLEWVECA